MEKGEALTHHKDHNILRLLKIDNVVDTNCIYLNQDDKLRYIVECFSRHDRFVFPVLGKEGELLGMIMLNDIRDKMFNQNLLDTTCAADYCKISKNIINYHDSFEHIMNVFDENQTNYLPVVLDGKFVGLISKSKLYSEYRKLMVKLSDE